MRNVINGSEMWEHPMFIVYCCNAIILCLCETEPKQMLCNAFMVEFSGNRLGQCNLVRCDPNFDGYIYNVNTPFHDTFD
jgi:hypothetical protein